VERAKVRAAIVRGLEMGAVRAVFDAETREALMAGRADPTLAELELDSLARMEVCIAIEIETRVTLAPEQLGRLRTFGDIVEYVVRELRV
jgi:hypothetical protein